MKPPFRMTTRKIIRYSELLAWLQEIDFELVDDLLRWTKILKKNSYRGLEDFDKEEDYIEELQELLENKLGNLNGYLLFMDQ